MLTLSIAVCKSILQEAADAFFSGDADVNSLSAAMHHDSAPAASAPDFALLDSW